MPSCPGVLYVVATPIGNLEDFTFRALRILKEVDLIAAEDTRRTAKLLAHYQVAKPMVSLREHNESREAPRLVARLLAGAKIALVSDAGTPAIADPGARLVRAALERGVTVTPIPGPSAVTAALSASGQLSTEFVFMGFPPATGASRRAWLERLAQEPRTVVFFEAPHRIERTLSEAKEILVDRQIIAHREITKMHEESVISPIKSATGEFTLVVSATGDYRPAHDPTVLPDIVGRITESGIFDDLQAIRVVAGLTGCSEQAARKAIKKYKFSVKQQKFSTT
jgi:16S rRNA (cytidine1402-2'-O)-methyltransferase